MLITPEKAKDIVDTQSGYIILDVRTKKEFDEGHIPGAVLIPYDELAFRAEAELPNKSQKLLLYCRSGRRSAIAANMLIDIGYTDVLDFGGIIDWPFDTVSE